MAAMRMGGREQLSHRQRTSSETFRHGDATRRADARRAVRDHLERSRAIANATGSLHPQRIAHHEPHQRHRLRTCAASRMEPGAGLDVVGARFLRDCATALKMIANGATRIGTSSGVAMTECLGRGPLPMRELLASPHVHGTHCASGLCAANEAKAAGASLY